METVLYEQKGQIGIITINREKQLNALNSEVLGDLSAAFDLVDLEAVRCVILTGAGKKSFVAGADIGEMSVLDKKGGEAFSKLGNDLLRKIETLAIPVIGAINGYALGGGCELSMACDFRLCSENAIFGQPEVGLGVMAGFGGSQRLPRLVGPAMAKEILYTGGKIDAAEALRIGLVNHVYSVDELMAETEKLANKIAKNAPIGVRGTKTAVGKGLEMGMDDALAMEATMFGSCFATYDQKEGMGAFLEKRKTTGFLNK